MDTPAVPLPPPDGEIVTDPLSVSECNQVETTVEPTGTESLTTSSYVENNTPETVEV